jgi:hypothetical protein
MLRMCKNCRSPFRPHIKVPGQQYCCKSECQKARRKHWQKIKLQEDDDYKKNKASTNRPKLKTGKTVQAVIPCFLWCRGTESNCRHGDFQSPALPTELPRHETVSWLNESD